MSQNLNKSTKDTYFMNLALLQAKRYLGNTRENPSVGCVLVKNNNVLSVGSTNFNGRPHAEYLTIKKYKKNIRNSILFTTLEPCSHYGKTPPCTNIIIKNKINKVFFSVNDPDLRSFNKCSKLLKNAGIKVKRGVLKESIKKFYRSYYKMKNNKFPFVTCKLAISKDFFTKNTKKKWITNYFSRNRVHLLRSISDCLITSSKTIINDNPELNCRIPGLDKRSPSRIVLDKNLESPLSSKVFLNAYKYKTFIFHNKINEKKISALKKMKVKLEKIPLHNNKLNLSLVLIKAKRLGYSRIFLESGLILTNAFLKEKLVDEFKLFVSDNKIGVTGKKSAKKLIKYFLKNKKADHEKVNLFNEKLITYKLK